MRNGSRRPYISCPSRQSNPDPTLNTSFGLKEYLQSTFRCLAYDTRSTPWRTDGMGRGPKREGCGSPSPSLLMAIERMIPICWSMHSFSVLIRPNNCTDTYFQEYASLVAQSLPQIDDTEISTARFVQLAPSVASGRLRLCAIMIPRFRCATQDLRTVVQSDLISVPVP